MQPSVFRGRLASRVGALSRVACHKDSYKRMVKSVSSAQEVDDYLARTRAVHVANRRFSRLKQPRA